MKFPKDMKPENIKEIRRKLIPYTLEINSIEPVKNGWYVQTPIYNFYFNNKCEIIDYQFNCKNCY